jgi:SAM-dependent methyltransferase
MSLVDAKSVLDIASGEGYGSYLLAQRARFVTGVDISEEAVNHAKCKYAFKNLEFRQGSAIEIPLANDTVDIVVSFETIEHHDRHDDMLEEIKRVLKPNGVLIMSSPDKLYYSEMPGIINPFHVKELYADEFRCIIRRHFDKSIFLSQKHVFGSIITTDNAIAGCREFSVDYSHISETKNMQAPRYNLCIASDGDIPELTHSCFCSQKSTDCPDMVRISTLEGELLALKSSRSFKLASIAIRLSQSVRRIFQPKRKKQPDASSAI